MDRPDERRDDVTRDDDVTNDETRDNGTLGIGDANPPRDRVRRDSEKGGRTLRDDRDFDSGSREVQQTPGATGIDMGAGGTGTDIERD